MELQIPFYGIHVGRFTALSGDIRLLEAIAFGICRRLSPSIAAKRKFLSVDLTVSLADPENKSGIFKCLYVLETTEWE